MRRLTSYYYSIEPFSIAAPVICSCARHIHELVRIRHANPNVRLFQLPAILLILIIPAIIERAQNFTMPRKYILNCAPRLSTHLSHHYVHTTIAHSSGVSACQRVEAWLRSHLNALLKCLVWLSRWKPSPESVSLVCCCMYSLRWNPAFNPHRTSRL